MMGKCESCEEAESQRDELLQVGFLDENILIHPANVRERNDNTNNLYGITALGGFIGADAYVRDMLQKKVHSESLLNISDLQTRYMLLQWGFRPKIHYWLRTTRLDLQDDFIREFKSRKGLYWPPYSTTPQRARRITSLTLHG